MDKKRRDKELEIKGEREGGCNNPRETSM